jgi:hypothetical protein
MKIVENDLKKYILAHNSNTDKYMVLEYVTHPNMRGYINLFSDGEAYESVLFTKGSRKAWDIIKTSDTLNDIIENLQLSQEYEELRRNVSRYFELNAIITFDPNASFEVKYEYEKLVNKLMKVR